MTLQEAYEQHRQASRRLREAQIALDVAEREHRIARETVETVEARLPLSAEVKP